MSKKVPHALPVHLEAAESTYKPLPPFPCLTNLQLSNLSSHWRSVWLFCILISDFGPQICKELGSTDFRGPLLWGFFFMDRKITDLGLFQETDAAREFLWIILWYMICTQRSQSECSELLSCTRCSLCHAGRGQCSEIGNRLCEGFHVCQKKSFHPQEPKTSVMAVPCQKGWNWPLHSLQQELVLLGGHLH